MNQTLFSQLTLEGPTTPGPIDLNPQEWFDYLAVPGYSFEYRVVAIDCGNNDLGTTPVSPPVVFPVATSKKLPANEFTIYPNPGKDNTRLEWKNTITKGNIELCNSMGAIVKTINLTGENMVISISDIPSGIYMVRLQTPQGVTVKKIVKE